MTLLWRKLSGLLRRNRVESELREEMQTHVAMRAAGEGPRAARVQFGNPALHLEDSRAAWGFPRLEDWLRDLRYATRIVFRKPAFAATVILTLALGIGSSSTIFSLIDTVLIRPLPYPNPHRLVAVSEARLPDAETRVPISPGRLDDWHRLSAAFEALAGSFLDSLNDTTGALPQRVSGAFVSPRFFRVLGTPAAHGRVLQEQEEVFGGAASIVISDGFWRRRFGGDPSALGRNLTLSGNTYTIVGVMPPAFRYPDPSVEIWVPAQTVPALLKIREARFYSGIARLKDGVSVGQAHANLLAVQQTLGGQYPKTDAGWSNIVEPLKDRLVGRVRLALGLLLGSVSLLLLIACANVACLMLARLNSRATEIGTRRSLGAGRAAIARQLFAEGLIYSAAGGVLGLAVVLAGISLLRKYLPEVPRIQELSVDPRLFAVVAGISVLAALLFSLAPILQTFRDDLIGLIGPAGTRVVGGGQRLPRLLVAAQLALATALLVGAGLFVRTLTHLEETPLGFHPENVLALRVSATFTERPDAVVQRHQRMLDMLSSLPGVTAVSMTTGLPGVSTTWPREFVIAGEQSSDGTLRFATWRVVTSDYFRTVGIPILSGQSCRMKTSAAEPFELLVNSAFAGRYFTGRDPIGHRLTQGIAGDLQARIVGVVANSREDGPGAAPQPLIYACGYLRFFADSEYLVQVRNPAASAATVRRAVQQLEPARTVYSVRPLTDALHGALSQTRVRTLLVGIFSLMALTLSAIGLYGVMAYMVSLRTREIGVRIALGAAQTQVLAEIVRSGIVLAAAGVIAGIAIAAAMSRFLTKLLFGIPPTDALSYLAAASVLFTVALIACLIPGRRATAIDPAQALRAQ